MFAWAMSTVLNQWRLKCKAEKIAIDDGGDLAHPASHESDVGQGKNPLARERAAREAEGWARYTAPVELCVR
jgi:hypothetical protein